VYYGSISDPPSPEECRILNQWDMLVVDPSQPGVRAALSSLAKPPTYIVGRFDIMSVVGGVPELDETGKVKAIINAVSNLMGPVNHVTPYNGVLLAQWHDTITVEICNEIIGFLNRLNLNVYNEIIGPRFMDKLNSSIATDQLAGMMFVNGSIMANGERRDYPNLVPMKTALDVATSQSCSRDFTILMCEIIDDEVPLTNAVVRRAFTWSSYFGAMLWVGRRSTIFDSTKNFIVQSPDSAFAWLKKDKVVNIHDKWRHNCKVQIHIELTDDRSPMHHYTQDPCTQFLNRSSLVSLRRST
jgi:hypothetical protein